ncbi:MAG: EpsG family protein [Propionibacteriaceae bacterium]|nr:EpsG family protein [Propionibacteriaceae bacterium]
MTETMGPTRRARSSQVVGGLVVLLLLFGLWVFNGENPDTLAYSEFFAYARTSYLQSGFLGSISLLMSSTRYEPGFVVLNVFVASLGWDYQLFVVLVACGCLLAVWYCARRYTQHPAMILALYAAFPFVLDVIQIRYTLAQAIMLVSMQFLARRSVLNVVRFCLLTALAASFHSIAILWLVVLIVYVANARVVLIVCGVSSVIGTTAVLMIPGIGDWILRMGGGSDIYLGQGLSWRRYLAYLGLAAVLVFFAQGRFRGAKTGDRKVLSLVVCAGITFAFLTPLNDQFFRLYRTIIIVMYLLTLGSLEERGSGGPKPLRPRVGKIDSTAQCGDALSSDMTKGVSSISGLRHPKLAIAATVGVSLVSSYYYLVRVIPGNEASLVSYILDNKLFDW